MAILKIENGKQYTGIGMINYIYDIEKHDNKVYGFGIGADLRNNIVDFMLTKCLCNKLEKNQYLQLVLSITEMESKDLSYGRMKELISFFEEVGYLIAQKFCVQMMGAIHGNTDNLHAHYILNTVCLNDGKMLNIKLKDLYDLKLDINNLLHRYDLNPIKVNHYD